MVNRFLLATLLFISACAPMDAITGTPQVLRLHATPAAQPWLVEAYTCAQSLGVVLSNVNDPENAEINLRVGEPEALTTPAYRIDQEDLLVVTHPDSPLRELSEAEVRELFTQPQSRAAQIWVFAPREDVQEVFSREVLDGQMVTSLARVALSPQQMSSALAEDKNAVGLLPGHLAGAKLRKIFSLPGVPVLAVVNTEPQGAASELLACLQK